LSDSTAGSGYPRIYAGYLGRIPFVSAWELQKEIWEERAEGRLNDDVFLLLEHEPVITLGAGGAEGNIISRESPAGGDEVPLYRINRGGEVTFHGPGQLMMYAICDLKERERDVHTHCRRLEEVFLRYLASLGVEARRREGMPGLWVGEEKILSLGVGARRWVTIHGVAFNISTNLRFFEMIHPCGEVGARVTTLERLSRSPHRLDEVAESLRPILADVFEQKISWSGDVACRFSSLARAKD
jgi:lipoate-protein ligase B